VDVGCDAVLVIVPAYLLSRMRRIERKRKVVIIFLCCGSALTLFGIMIATIIVYAPFAETEAKFAPLDCLTHLSVRCLLSTLVIEIELRHRPQRLFSLPICSLSGRLSISGWKDGSLTDALARPSAFQASAILRIALRTSLTTVT